MSALVRLGAAAALFAVCGCATVEDNQPCNDERFFRNSEVDHQSGWWKTKHYLMDSLYDLMDIVTLDVGLGKSGPALFFVNARATKYAEAGYGYWSGYKFGMLGRGLGTWREERYEGGFALLPIQNYSVHATRIPCCGTEPLRAKYMDAHGYDIDLDQNNHWADVGASLHLLFVGLDVNVSPFEALDFVFGLIANYPNPDEVTTHMPWDIGVDMADDDTRPSVYDVKTGRERVSTYSLWPTIWPTTFEHHEELEGAEWEHVPQLGPQTGSAGGSYGTYGK